MCHTVRRRTTRKNLTQDYAEKKTPTNCPKERVWGLTLTLARFLSLMPTQAVTTTGGHGQVRGRSPWLPHVAVYYWKRCQPVNTPPQLNRPCARSGTATRYPGQCSCSLTLSLRIVAGHRRNFSLSCDNDVGDVFEVYQEEPGDSTLDSE